MTMEQRRVLKRFVNDTNKRIDHVHYMRRSQKEELFIEYTSFRQDGSGFNARMLYDGDGYCTWNATAEVKT